MPPKSKNNQAWYRDGLHFECTQCGNCCTGAPGYVFVTDEEIDRIAQFLGQPGQGLDKKHLYRVGRRYSLTEDKKTGDCCFLMHSLDGRRTCGIYSVRPLQCRTWPFWDINLASPETWKCASRECPGMNHGDVVDYVQIELKRTAKRSEDLTSCPTASPT